MDYSYEPLSDLRGSWTKSSLKLPRDSTFVDGLYGEDGWRLEKFGTSYPEPPPPPLDDGAFPGYPNYDFQDIPETYEITNMPSLPGPVLQETSNRQEIDNLKSPPAPSLVPDSHEQGDVVVPFGPSFEVESQELKHHTPPLPSSENEVEEGLRDMALQSKSPLHPVLHEDKVQNDHSPTAKKPSFPEYDPGKYIWFHDVEVPESKDEWDMIRLVTLNPGEFDDEISCELSYNYLPNSKFPCGPHPLGKVPSYEALSYVWGQMNELQAILINGKRLNVGRSLAIALRYLRKRAKPRVLWIDAICINQLDVDEKNLQVRRMSQIYRDASCVLVWLGEETHNSGMAFDVIEATGGVEKETVWDERCSNYVVGRVWQSPADVEKLKGSETLGTEELTSLYDLFFGRSWWTRMWIVQEITYPRLARVICGHRSITWDSIHHMFFSNPKFESVGRLGPPEDVFKHVSSLVSLRHEGQVSEVTSGFTRMGTNLRKLLQENSTREATDPRDMIYAVLGLASCPQAVSIDYSKSVQEVYIEATKAMIADISNPGVKPRPSLNVICTAFRSALFSTSTLGLPSWVPDFSLRQDYPGIFQREFIDYKYTGNTPLGYCAMGSKEKLEKIPEISSDNVLSMVGIDFDFITKVSKPISGENGDHWEYTEWAPPNLSSTIYDATGEAGTEAFWRTILRDECGQGFRIQAQDRVELESEYLIWTCEQKREVLYEHFHENYSYIFDRQYRELEGMAFGISKKCYWGIFPSVANPGDRLCIGRGFSVPVVLREVGSDPDGPLYEFVGPAYIHGIMDGGLISKLEKGELEEKIIRIK